MNHAAIGNEKVYMTTKLNKSETTFLPFNKDIENPINPNGHKTAYLWEDILQPDTLLDIINNYLHIQRVCEKFYDPDKGVVEKERDVFIFPRYHQLDVVRKLLSAVKDQGVGNNYLIQHSAGSGKSNSIAWLSHQLTSLYQKEVDKNRLFDSIIVVSDRRILDKQLRDTIRQFEQTTGVVQAIDKHSDQLKKALEDGKHIIVTTLQKFPVISEKMTELKGHKFAVIIDEAHSSQSGESAKYLKKVLSANLEQAEEEDKGDFDVEDEIIKEIKTRGKQPHISYFAFTATPKNKTLELFGEKNEDGKRVAFHVYSMKQAIEEGFILDVLKNYTTFKRYFKLAKKIKEDKEFEKKKAIRLLTSYVDLQPHAIEMKSRIILDHFLEKTVREIEGRGRAMVVTRSRLHAVKFYQMLKIIMEEKKLGFKPLVAFSEEVKDPDTDVEVKYTENNLNRLPARVSITDAFKTPEYRILVVTNKFQTGFDEPLLHTMYMDKKLGGVNTVQTLSRLNRTMKGKTDTVIFDFVNEAEDIQEDFQEYYQTTILLDETDPNKLYDLQFELGQFEIFTDEDIQEFAKIFYDEREPEEKLQPILDKAVFQFKQKEENEREDFRSIIQSYNRLYGYISQLITFVDVDLEKLYVFTRHLNRKLPKRKGHLPYEVQDAVDLDSFRIQQTFKGCIHLKDNDGGVTGLSVGSPHYTYDEKNLISNIIKTLNEIHELNLTEEDKVDIKRIKTKLEENEELRSVINSDNTMANIRYKFDQVLDALLLEFVRNKTELYKKLTDPKVSPLFKQKWFEGYYEQHAGPGK